MMVVRTDNGATRLVLQTLLKAATSSLGARKALTLTHFDELLPEPRSRRVTGACGLWPDTCAPLSGLRCGEYGKGTRHE
jgi:hypothetical protein